MMLDWYDSLDHTMPELVRCAAREYGDDPFIVDGDRIVSFRELAQQVESVARSLLARGVTTSDRVAIWAPNSGDWIIAACAIQMIGAIMVPVNTRFKGQEAGHVLKKSGAKLLFTVGSFLDSDYVGLLQAAMGGEKDGRPVSGLPDLGAIVLFEDSGAQPAAIGWTLFLGDAAPAAALDAHEAQVTPETIGDILFTSGTTGEPKGAMHSQGQSLWMISIWNRANRLRHGDRMLVINPFFHSFGYRSGWVSALLAGITVYPLAIFDPDEVIRRISEDRITVLMGPPTLYSSLLDNPARSDHDLSSLRVGHTGAANISSELIHKAHEELGFDIFMTSFGLTEVTALATVSDPNDDFETVASSVGRALPRVELRIASPDGTALPAGQEGELLVRGPNVMQGYFLDPAATAATIDTDGWLHTGDLATISEDGLLRIIGRLKDIVIVGGFNAYPAEIENVLATHPAIAEIAIIAVPDPRQGEVCGACVVLRQGAALTAAELTAWSRERLANYKVPRHLFIRDALPRTPLGKVQKFLIRDEALRSLAVPEA